MAKIKRLLYLLIILLSPSIIREIFFPEDDYLGGGYTFNSNAIWGDKPEQTDIPNEVIEYNYNSKYIIAKQLYVHAVDVCSSDLLILGIGHMATMTSYIIGLSTNKRIQFMGLWTQ